jgi:hypothetical protein
MLWHEQGQLDMPGTPLSVPPPHIFPSPAQTPPAADGPPDFSSWDLITKMADVAEATEADPGVLIEDALSAAVNT